MVKTMVRQAVPLQPMEVNGGAGIHLQPVEDPSWSRWMCLKEAVTPWRAHAGAGSCQHLWPCGEEPMLEQVCWQDLWPHGRDPTLEQKSVRRKVQQRQHVMN